jgi:hypothetical protein
VPVTVVTPPLDCVQPSIPANTQRAKTPILGEVQSRRVDIHHAQLRRHSRWPRLKVTLLKVERGGIEKRSRGQRVRPAKQKQSAQRR